MHRLRRLLHRAVATSLGPILRRMLVLADDQQDSWARTPHRLSVRLFGPGSTHDFRWYFEGTSAVPVAGVTDLCDWLLACEYHPDSSLFHEHDFWQHPRTFEALRKGDCEDHAIWAWRKLVELGTEATFVTGRCLSGPAEGPHAWVVFRDGGSDYLLETTARSREAMVRPLTEARVGYRPHFGVDHRLQTCAYVGYFQDLRRRPVGRRRDARRGGTVAGSVIAR